MSDFRRVAVAGAGAFGTALALAAERAGREVTLWGRDHERLSEIAEARENKAHLPGVRLPASIGVTAATASLREAELVLLAAPAQATRSVLVELANHFAADAALLACAKGIEQDTGLSQTRIIAALRPQARSAALSGPGFAEEMAAGLPTAVTIAATDISLAEDICAALSSDTFRPYASDDLVGVELGGAVKNVLAIACGVVAGRGLGESARAALIARGLGEMTRLGLALGARQETFMGLSGLGDLVLTATSAQSRNLAFGIALARGLPVRELLADGAPLIEGAHTAGIAAKLARKHGIELPIIAAVARLVEGAIDVDQAIVGLVNRPLRRETG